MAATPVLSRLPRAARRRVVITGVAGFVGSHVAERLVADGWGVVGIDAFTPFYDRGDKEANLAALVTEPRFELVVGDVAATPLARLLADRPAVIHLAAQPGVRDSFGADFDRYVHDNILVTQRLFDAARATGTPRVVYASSSSVYGDAAAYPCSEETTPPRPRSPYGVTKRTGEKLAAIYRSLGVETVGLRYFTVYGPRQRPDMAIRRICEAASGGPPFQLDGDGEQSRDFTYVADAVDATVRAITATAPDQLINIGGGRESTLNDVLADVAHLAGHAIPVRRGAAQPGDARRTGADTARARRTLGWRPRTALVDGLAAELAWVRSRRERLIDTEADSTLDGQLVAGRLS